MSTLANETIYETLFEETLEEMGINEDSPFFADAYKISSALINSKLYLVQKSCNTSDRQSN